MSLYSFANEISSKLFIAEKTPVLLNFDIPVINKT